MSASDNNQGPVEYDEELLALAPPPPGLRHALFILSFLVLSGFMLYWFSPEMGYLLEAFGGPDALGDAPDVEVDGLESHTYAAVDGIPMLSRTLVYNEGMKWFAMSDTERKMFPLSGNPRLYVQWTVPDSHEAYGANPALPAHFEGHLIDREDLGPNFDKVWVFFDCLQVHPINRCKHCIGRSDLDDCREAFTCVERNGPEECAEILEQSKASVEERVRAGGAVAEAESLLEALREQEIAVAGVRLEELVARAGDLYDDDMDAAFTAKVDGLRGDILRLRAKELAIRGRRVTTEVAAMGEDGRAAQEGASALLLELTREEPAEVKLLETLRSFIEVGGELERLERRSRWVRRHVARLDASEAEGLGSWKVDLATAGGEAVLGALGDIEATLATIARSHASVQAADAGAEREGEGDASVGDPSLGSDTDDAALDEVTPRTIATPQLWRIFEAFGALEARAAALKRKVARLAPGEVPAFDAWATKTNTVLQLCRSADEKDCKMPEGLRTDEVVSALARLEEMLAGIDPEEAGRKPLADRMGDEVDALDGIRARMKELRATAGLREYSIAGALSKAAADVEAARSRREIDEAQAALEDVRALMTGEGLLPASFRGMPQEMGALEEALAPAAIGELEARAKALEEIRGKRTFVLLDGELPIDKLWVAALYLLLVVMIAVNARKLWRFWIAWRA